MSSLTFSNFSTIIILKFGLYFTASVANFAYVSFITDTLCNVKYQTSKFQFLQSYSSLASMIFVPLSYFFYSYVKVEFLIIFSVILFSFSVAIILVSIYIETRSKKNEIQLVESFLEQNKIIEKN